MEFNGKVLGERILVESCFRTYGLKISNSAKLL